MKANTSRRLLAVIIALLMMVQLLPTSLLVAAVESDTVTYTFDATKDVTLGNADKEAIAEGTTYADGYFKVVGTVTQRTDSDVTKVKSVELAKNAGGAIEFTVTGTAIVTIGASSTGGSNTSIIALVDSEGNEIGRDEVTGTSFTDVTYADLTAGTYQIVCPDTGRNTRVETITVVETVSSTEGGGAEGDDEGENTETTTNTYTFDATKDVTLGNADKEAIAEGTTYADGYFKVVGTVTQRTDSDVTKVKSVELAKNAGGAIEFTVTGTAIVTIGASSTGGSNTSIIALVDSEGNEIGRDEVTGTSFTDVTYADLNAGTYQIVNPDSARNTRVETITVVETVGGGGEVEPEEPVTSWDFRLDEYTGQASYHGLTLTGNFAKHDATYGVRMTGGTFEIPVSGPCQIQFAVGYNWDITFPDGSNFTHESGGDVVYAYTGEAGTVTVTVGDSYTSYIAKIELTELVVEEEPATSWDFRLDEYTGQASYHGLTLTGNFAKHDATYGVRMTGGTFEIPVSGPCQINFAVGYNWDITFPDGSNFTHESGGDVVYAYTGEAGTVTVTVGDSYTSYIAKIELTELVVEPEETVDPVEQGKIAVWDFAGEALEGEQYINMLTADEINSWFAGVEPGSTGKNLVSFTTADGLLGFNDGGYTSTHRLRVNVTGITCYDTGKYLQDADGNVYNGYIYSNKSGDANVYLTIKACAGDTLTFVLCSNGTAFTANLEAPSGAVQTATGSPADSKDAKIVTFYATEDGTYKLYYTQEKLVVARIYRQSSYDVTVSGNVTAPAELTDYAIVFTNTASGAQVVAPVTGGTYTAVLKDGYTYTVSLADANGYIITSEETLTVEAGAEAVAFDVTVEAVALVTVTGTIEGLSEAVLAKLKLSFQADTLYVPEVTISGTTYTVQLEMGVTYTVVAEGINDYTLTSSATVSYTADTTANVVFEAKPVYKVTIVPEGCTLADLANATFTFTNLNEEGYVYTFTGAENIALRNGVYSVEVTNSGIFAQQLTSNLKVEGANVSKTIRFSGEVNEWDFSDEDFAGTSPYNGLEFSNGQKNKTYLLANTGTITVPVSGDCKIVVYACYQYSFYFTSEEEASVGIKTGSTSQIDAFAYVYTGEAGTVTINVLGQSYITKIEIVELVQFKDTVTVGAEGCDYTTINAALNAIKAMDRPNNERVTVLIQPGNYEEMLVVDVPNVTLKNASETPSIDLINEGVDIAENAVRITWYYGHGYTYYSMGSDCKFHEDILRVNKENGYASFVNPGSGTTNGSYWNATVVITADGFQAEGIIFENSFNQYVSAAAANDIIEAQSSAKEGAVARGQLPVFSTAVQDKAYVERAAALAIANNCSEIYFENCKFVGRQDTLYGGVGTTAAFYECSIYGGTDYIFGGMTAVFAKCDLVFNTSDSGNDVGYITAGQQGAGSRGFLMYNCTITSTTPGVDTASQYASKPGYFGRPWAANTAEVVFYMTNIDATCNYWYGLSASLIRPDGWLSTLSGESALVGEYGTYEIALGVDNAGKRVAWANVFETEHLADGTPITIEAFLGEWDAFAGKDLTIVMSTEKVDNSKSEEEEEDNGPTVTVTKKHSFDAATDVKLEGDNATKDKAPVVEGTTFDNGYFTVIGVVSQRYDEKKGGVHALELSKNAGGGVQFTITGEADVVFQVASTGGSNTSAVALINVETGEVLTNVEGLTEVTGTGATVLTYKDLPAGTYQIISARSDLNRGLRLISIDVTERFEVPAATGDNMEIFVLVMFLSAIALVVILPRKKRMF